MVKLVCSSSKMVILSHGYVIVKISRIGDEVECDVFVVTTRLVVEDLPVHILVGVRAGEGYVNDRYGRPSLKCNMTSYVVGPESKDCSKGLKSFSFTVILARVLVRGLSVKISRNKESLYLSFSLAYCVVHRRDLVCWRS